MSDHATALSQLPRWVNAAFSEDAQQQLVGVTECRKLLSGEHNAHIDEVVAAGVVPRFVQLLARDQQPQLQFEAAWALANIAAGTAAQARTVVEAGAVAHFVRLLASPAADVSEQVTWALGNLASNSPQVRDLALQHGAMNALLQVVVASSSRRPTSFVRCATRTIAALCRGEPAPSYDLVSPALPVLARLINSPDEEVLTDACCALFHLTEGPSHRIQAVIDGGICRRVLELLAHSSYAVQLPALKIVGNIATGDDRQTQHLIDLACLSRLSPLLASPKKSIRKDACWTLSNITAGNAEQVQAVIDQGSLIPQLVDLMGQNDVEVNERALWAIANAINCCVPDQILYLVERGRCLQPLCALLGCHKADMLKLALDALGNVLRTLASGQPNESPCAMHIEALGGLDKIEELQQHRDPAISEMATNLLSSYFGWTGDDDDDGMESEANHPTQSAFSFGTFHAALP